MQDYGLNEHPLVNYHTHTWRCQHASGTEEDYVRAAVAAGFKVLGFADHTPWPYESGPARALRGPAAHPGGAGVRGVPGVHGLA